VVEVIHELHRTVTVLYRRVDLPLLHGDDHDTNSPFMRIVPYKAFYWVSSPIGAHTRTLSVRIGRNPDFKHQARAGAGGGLPYPRDRILCHSIAPGFYYIPGVSDRLANLYLLIAG